MCKLFKKYKTIEARRTSRARDCKLYTCCMWSYNEVLYTLRTDLVALLREHWQAMSISFIFLKSYFFISEFITFQKAHKLLI